MPGTDDAVACADDPAPVMSGENPAFAGKPISLLSGAEKFTRVDLTIGTTFPISITRSYDSMATYDSPAGYGWAINFDRRLYTYPDNSVTLRKDCGWKRRFTWSVAGYIRPAGESGKLVKNVSDGSYTYTSKSGDQDIYDTQGRLVKRLDTNGNYLLISYAAESRTPLWGLLLSNILDPSLPVPRIVGYDHRLSKIEEYDALGSPTGKRVDFYYDTSNGRLWYMQDNNGRRVTYGHDTIGNLNSVSGPGGSAVYEYTDPRFIHRMTSVDEGQGAYINEYNDQGRIKKQTHGTGVIDFEYLDANKKTKITTTVRDSQGAFLNTQARTVEFDSQGQVWQVTDAYGNVTAYERNSAAQVTHEEHKENTGTIDAPILVLKTSSDYTYDGGNNMLTKVEASNTSVARTTTYNYYYEKDPAAPPAMYNKLWKEIRQSVVFPTDPAKEKVTTYDYYTNGNLKSVTETGFLGDGTPFSDTTLYEYSASNGKIAKITGPRFDVTNYEYDSITGNLQYLTRAHGTTYAQKTTYADWDSFGNPRSVTDQNNNVTTYSYDDQTGRVLTVKAPGNTAVTQYVYVLGSCSSCGGGGANKIDYIILPEGNKIDYDYNDGYGNLTKISDNAGNSINYTYDSEGNRLTEEIKDASGILQKTLGYQYDALNRLKQIQYPDGSHAEYGYDDRANRTSSRSPNGYMTTYQYDALNRLETLIQPGGFTRSSSQMITRYGYNHNDNMSTVTDNMGYLTDPNQHTTTYKYDDKGRVYQVISPDTGTTTYTYDTAGNLTSKKDAKNITISYQYDALNRLTKIDFPTDTDIVYAYDTCLKGQGKICTMSDASGSTTYEYTPKGQIKKETKEISAITYVVEYSYDQNGNVKTMTYPGGRVITYNYSNNKVTSVLSNTVSLAANISYKPFGEMTSIAYGNNLIGGISYDNEYRIRAILLGTISNLKSAQSLSYDVYDSNGNIKNIKDNIDATKNKSFTYDTVDALWTASVPGGTYTWLYDLAGNRTSETINSSWKSYDYTPGTNKLSAMTGPTWFQYDENGNTAQKIPGTNYYYNQNQRLIRVSDSGVTKGEYTYNGNGQRVKKQANYETTIFHYNQTGQLIAESDSAGTITAEYVYLNGQPLAKMEGANTYYYHNDHLGTPQKMTDSSGTVVWAADYKPFGEAAVTVSTITNNLRFPGQYFDQETGLNYNYYRDYNPVIGRYIEADPIGQQGGLNLFGYGQNNPIIKMDFWGLEANGCGSADWRSTLVPDSPFFIINFQSACDTHDNCYGKCGANKATCDSEFRTNMKVLCYYKYNLDIVTDVPTLPNPVLYACYGFAQLYYNAVSNHGQSAYDAAQKNCPCRKK